MATYASYTLWLYVALTAAPCQSFSTSYSVFDYSLVTLFVHKEICCSR